MAKELPYFKFEPSEWQNGNIQMCSIEAKLIFVDICCSYWQRLGDLPYAFALHRHCNGNKDVMHELESAEVLEHHNGNLTIKFLDEQIEELSKKSDKARKSALERWNKKKRNANALKPQSEGNAIRREENRIDNTLYSKKEFLKDWNELRTKHLKKPSFLNSLTVDDLSNLNDLSKDYSREQFRQALTGLFNQEKMPNGNTTMQSNPKHFLTHFNAYLTAFHDRNTSLYGKEKVEA